jgi:medium-chain acyl-[acyl-carrier-protein] hydrolase
MVFENDLGGGRVGEPIERHGSPYAPWVNGRLVDDESKPIRLFCFSHAGAGASAYHEWDRELPDTSVYAVQLPGHESRWAERPFTNATTLVANLCGALGPLFTGKFAFFGHSMGAVVAFELARELRRRGKPGPAVLLASGMRAPQLPDRFKPAHKLPDEQFLFALRAFNGIPESVLANNELLNLLIPVLRADLQICETYQYKEEPPLECRISVFGGWSDPRVTRVELEAWSLQAKEGSVRLRMFSGDHFFPATARRSLLKAVANDLTMEQAEVTQ